MWRWKKSHFKNIFHLIRLETANLTPCSIQPVLYVIHCFFNRVRWHHHIIIARMVETNVIIRSNRNHQVCFRFRCTHARIRLTKLFTVFFGKIVLVIIKLSKYCVFITNLNLTDSMETGTEKEYPGSTLRGLRTTKSSLDSFQKGLVAKYNPKFKLKSFKPHVTRGVVETNLAPPGRSLGRRKTT